VWGAGQTRKKRRIKRNELKKDGKWELSKKKDSRKKNIYNNQISKTIREKEQNMAK